MKKRNPIGVAALTLVTFTLYAYYWLYQTTDELKRVTGRRELNPLLDVVLTLLTFGFWGMWAAYRNAKVTHETLRELGEEHSDRSLGVAVFCGLSLVSGWAWLVGMMLLQEDLNQLAEHEHDYFADARAYETGASQRDEVAGARAASPPRRAPARVRVDVDPYGEPAAASAWEHAPSAPVFESTAPAPIVY